MPETTLTLETQIHCPDLIRGGRTPWTGTVGEMLAAHEKRIGSIIADMEADGRLARLADDADDERDDGMIAAAMTLVDVRRLVDDPNAEVVA